ncbi:hypothetical protein J3F80_002490 [Coemansia sp. RSA 2526]|nr:hypothetical protein J3F80_002490 [Coemansia sp. RSA 2526]
MAGDRRPYARDNDQRDSVKRRSEARQQSASGAEKGATRRAKFVSNEESVENKLKLSTIGLVKLEEFQRIKGELEEERQRAAANTLARSAAKDSDPEAQPGKPTKKQRTKNKQPRAVLSFDNDSGDDNVVANKPRKNPDVDTSFLPDAEREAGESQQREALRQQWLRDQEVLKQESIEITYSYWDGTGHRKQATCQKGWTIAQFLNQCRSQVPELRSCSVDNLVYIKEDVIIPHHYTFYDFIVNKARGKSGPLFNFDVHDDVRLENDIRVEKDDSHAGKVCERAWYERNKHIFPANRWEAFDPEKTYGSYTIRDSKQGASKRTW